MKKNLFFVIPMVVIAAVLFMLRATGMTAHMIVSGLGLLTLIAYTVSTKKEWKKPVLEILQRICYAVALITGVVLMNVSGVAVLAIVHKISAVLFALLFIATEIHKAIKK